MEEIRQTHEFGPVYDAEAKILILGSFPSVKSREVQFYYGHPQNRFWKVLGRLYEEEVPQDISGKKEFLKRHGIALWDVIESCEITGSSDSSIKNVVPNNPMDFLEKTKITKIYTNGKTAEKLYRKYVEPMTGIKTVGLPSTSPANAAFSLERLLESWKVILE
ncbi:MAG: DNA-deoxyinosine glycosylase [Lachnospiraceae bacterium]|nr:DNA-deoxyinosine glycosylase [Lachnospiraceae bacterium]